MKFLIGVGRESFDLEYRMIVQKTIYVSNDLGNKLKFCFIFFFFVVMKYYTKKHSASCTNIYDGSKLSNYIPNISLLNRSNKLYLSSEFDKILIFLGTP